MSHLDEGTLHALLDGELGSTEVMEIEAHLDGCTACSARLRDAREFLGEADRLVGRVQFGRYAAGTGAPAAAAPSPTSATPPRRPPPPPPRPGPEENHPWEDTSPVLLIPDNPKSGGIGPNWPRLVGWAAAITLVLSGGYLASRFTGTEPTNLASAPSRPTLVSPEPPAVASPAETEQVDSAPANPPAAARTEPAPAAPPAEPKPAPPREKTPPRDLASNPPAPAKTRAAPPPAATASAPAAATPPPQASADEATDANADANEEAATKAAEQDAIRFQAARALSQLDRERRVGRAAAATAALDRAELDRRGNTAGAVAPPPPPPTPEQRAQVYLRIGLDEANRQLGGPVHVIEGMSAVFMGLAPGRVAAGADTTKPVVRVVYQDPQGRMIFLDQQRSATQAPPPASSGAWALGSVIVGLRGEAPADVLRSLRARVR